LRIVKRTEGVSTTDIIGRLLTLSRQHHEAPRPSSPVGIRVSPQAAYEQLSPSLSPAVPLGQLKESLDLASKAHADCGASEANDLVEQMIAKYKISENDAAILRTHTRAGPDTGAKPVAQTKDQLRTKAPVQLLASTRRLVEFASSKQPTEADKIVYVSGGFDMFHVGHAQFLKDARALGTFLLVGIHEDSTVRQRKGPSFPVMNLNERVLNVCACKWVDEVIIGAPNGVTEDILKTWGVSVVVRGTSHKRNLTFHKDIADPFAVPKEKNILAEIPSKWPELCHDTIVERIMMSRQSYLKRNTDRAKREDDYYQQKSTNDPKEDKPVTAAPKVAAAPA